MKTTGAFLALALSIPTAALAQGTEGYATGPATAVWKTPYGLCWRTTSWTPSNATADCDADLVRKPVAAAAPPPAPPAPVAPPPVAPVAKPAPAPIVAAPVVVKPAPAPKPTPLTIGAAELFGFNQGSLTSEGRSKLDKDVIARANKEYSDIRGVSISGHTDRLGSTEYNQKLSERRADAVRAYLVSRGMDGSKVESRGYGEAKPVKACPDQKNRKALIECLAPNRRVEIEINGTRR